MQFEIEQRDPFLFKLFVCTYHYNTKQTDTKRKKIVLLHKNKRYQIF